MMMHWWMVQYVWHHLFFFFLLLASQEQLLFFLIFFFYFFYPPCCFFLCFFFFFSFLLLLLLLFHDPLVDVVSKSSEQLFTRHCVHLSGHNLNMSSEWNCNHSRHNVNLRSEHHCTQGTASQLPRRTLNVNSSHHWRMITTAAYMDAIFSWKLQTPIAHKIHRSRLFTFCNPIINTVFNNSTWMSAKFCARSKELFA